MKKVLIALVAVVCAAFYVFVLYDRMTADKTAPEITYEGELLYDPAMESEQLLAGVKATDDKDGDVSASLSVESVDMTLVQGEAVITYIARDSRNNIGRLKRYVPFAEGVEQPQILTEITKTEDPAQDGAAEEVTSGDELSAEAPAEAGAAEAPAEPGAADATAETEAPAEAGAAEAPVEAAPTPATIELEGQTFADMTDIVTEGLTHINAATAGHEADADPNTPFVKLLQDSLEIESGEYVNIRSLVDVAYPEGSAVTTSPFALLRMIKIDGLDGQEARVFSTPGIYKFSIYVVDSQNNFKKSNTRTFTLTVK